MQASPVTLTRNVTPDVDQIGTFVPAPGLGVLPVNAYVLHAREPLLVDAGVQALADATLDAIAQSIDLESLRYVYLTHTDPDHAGCVRQVLERAPRARLVTTYLGMGKLGLTEPVAPERVLLLNPGQRLDLGDRQVVAGRPPVFDAPETTWLHAPDDGVLFSADCFGAVMASPVDDAAALSEAALAEGMVTWTGIDAPWLWQQDRAALRQRLRAIEAQLTGTVLGGHLPPARDMGARLLALLARASETQPAPAPDQAAFEAMLQGLVPAA